MGCVELLKIQEQVLYFVECSVFALLLTSLFARLFFGFLSVKRQVLEVKCAWLGTKGNYLLLLLLFIRFFALGVPAVITTSAV